MKSLKNPASPAVKPQKNLFGMNVNKSPLRTALKKQSN